MAQHQKLTNGNMTDKFLARPHSAVSQIGSTSASGCDLMSSTSKCQIRLHPCMPQRILSGKCDMYSPGMPHYPGGHVHKILNNGAQPAARNLFTRHESIAKRHL